MKKSSSIFTTFATGKKAFSRFCLKCRRLSYPFMKEFTENHCRPW